MNASLLKIQKQVSLALTGLSPFQGTIYPHEQVLLDVQLLNQAITSLQAPADTDAALSALAGVDLTSNGLMLSHDVYAHLLTRMDPSYYRVAWGAQGHPVWPLLDVMPQYNAIEAGTWNAQTVAQLTAMRDQDLTDLNSRLNAMSASLEAGHAADRCSELALPFPLLRAENADQTKRGTGTTGPPLRRRAIWRDPRLSWLSRANGRHPGPIRWLVSPEGHLPPGAGRPAVCGGMSLISQRDPLGCERPGQPCSRQSALSGGARDCAAQSRVLRAHDA